MRTRSKGSRFKNLSNACTTMLLWMCSTQATGQALHGPSDPSTSTLVDKYLRYLTFVLVGASTLILAISMRIQVTLSQPSCCCYTLPYSDSPAWRGVGCCSCLGVRQLNVTALLVWLVVFFIHLANTHLDLLITVMFVGFAGSHAIAAIYMHFAIRHWQHRLAVARAADERTRALQDLLHGRPLEDLTRMSRSLRGGARAKRDAISTLSAELVLVIQPDFDYQDYAHRMGLLDSTRVEHDLTWGAAQGRSETLDMDSAPGPAKAPHSPRAGESGVAGLGSSPVDVTVRVVRHVQSGLGFVQGALPRPPIGALSMPPSLKSPPSSQSPHAQGGASPQARDMRWGCCASPPPHARAPLPGSSVTWTTSSCKANSGAVPQLCLQLGALPPGVVYGLRYVPRDAPAVVAAEPVSPVAEQEERCLRLSPRTPAAPSLAATPECPSSVTPAVTNSLPASHLPSAPSQPCRAADAALVDHAAAANQICYSLAAPQSADLPSGAPLPAPSSVAHMPTGAPAPCWPAAADVREASASLQGSSTTTSISPAPAPAPAPALAPVPAPASAPAPALAPDIAAAPDLAPAPAPAPSLEMGAVAAGAMLSGAFGADMLRTLRHVDP